MAERKWQGLKERKGGGAEYREGPWRGWEIAKEGDGVGDEEGGWKRVRDKRVAVGGGREGRGGGIGRGQGEGSDNQMTLGGRGQDLEPIGENPVLEVVVGP